LWGGSQVLAIQPGNNDALFWLAGSHLARRDASKALTLLAQGKKRDPGNPRWLLAETQALASTGKVPEARAQLEAARKSENVTEEILQQLASLQLAMRDGEAAAQTYQELRGRNGSSLEYQLGQAGSVALAGDLTKAAEMYEAIEKNAGNDARPWLQHAALLNQIGQKDKAFALYEEALRRDKNNPLILNNLAWAVLERGGPAERALEFAQQAKRIAGRSPQIDDTLAAAYSKLAMYRNAIAVYEEMLTYLPPAQRGEVVKQLEAAKRMSAKQGGPA
jgi:tetratricopeptide (TPR) repeat protein